MLTIIYPFKNREKERVIRSLNSIYNQNNKEFNVVFVDYGSDNPIDFSSFFPLLKYVYLNVRNQPWNKSKAINYALKHELTTPYFFISDVDIIYKNNFIDTIYSLILHHNIFYFQVAYLKKELTDSTNVFDANNVSKVSNCEATGMTVFRTEIVKELNGFDEFFHFWGSEDTDIHNRIKNHGHEVFFYDLEVLLYHQWHISYIRGEDNKLTVVPQLTNIIQINYLHSKYNQENNVTAVNEDDWGKVYGNSELDGNQLIIESYKPYVDYWLYQVVYNLCIGEELNLRFILPKKDNGCREVLRWLIKGAKVPHYNLKEVNDKILLMIVTSLHQQIYSYSITDDLKAIIFKLKMRK